ncbi:hypothetical protein LUX57_40550 [Actinomadura madurae]|nr:hypothetical protein [Actinomadura madurae]MCP9970691.1 hypothetical protein [Actinomadura madurae]
MSRPGDADGWAPLDPELDREAQGNPQPAGPEPASQPPQAAWPQAAPQPYGQPYGPEQGQGHPAGSPYWQGAPAQPPGAYGTGEYRAAPYGQGQYGQGQYGPGQYGPGPYGGGYGMPPVKRPWTVETPEGVPFHRMARTEVHRWWRPLVGTVGIAAVGMALALGLMIIGIIVTVAVTGDTPEPSGNQSVFENDTADLAFNLGALAMFLPVALAAAWVVQRRRPGTLSSVAGRLRWRWLLACCGLAILFCAVSYGTSIIAATGLDDQSSGDEHWVGWGRFLGPAIVIILLVPFQAAAEEYAFRGWMLQAVGACTLETARGRAGRAFSTVFRTPWPGDRRRLGAVHGRARLHRLGHPRHLRLRRDRGMARGADGRPGGGHRPARVQQPDGVPLPGGGRRAGHRAGKRPLAGRRRGHRADGPVRGGRRVAGAADEGADPHGRPGRGRPSGDGGHGTGARVIGRPRARARRAAPG